MFVITNEYVTTWPTVKWPASLGVADLTIEMAGAGVAVTTAVDGGETGDGPFGGVPDAVAVLTICPASTSAWVGEYVAVQVMLAPAARDAAPAGQSMTG
ncbi:hypothetical protein SB767_29575, partial [Bacillus sp. SIMBA_069]